MPALPPAPNVVRIDYRGLLAGNQPWVVHDFFQYSGAAPTVAVLNTWAAAIATALTAHVTPLMNQQTELVDFVLTDLTSPSSATTDHPMAVFGGRTDVPLPPAASFIIQKRVSRRFRGGHSRAYWPFGGDTALNTTIEWGAVFSGQVLAGYTAYVAAVESGAPGSMGTITQVSVSYYEGFHIVTPPSGRSRTAATRRVAPVIDLVTSLTTNARVGSQRRRDQQSS